LVRTSPALGTSAATPKAARCPVARSIVFSTCWFSAVGFWKSVLELFRIVVTGCAERRREQEQDARADQHAPRAAGAGGEGR
jgi:hypothetical protein